MQGRRQSGVPKNLHLKFSEQPGLPSTAPGQALCPALLSWGAHSGRERTGYELTDFTDNFKMSPKKAPRFNSHQKVFHVKGLSNSFFISHFKGMLYSCLAQLPNADLSRAPFSAVDVLKSLLTLRSNHALEHVRHYHLFFKNQS